MWYNELLYRIHSIYLNFVTLDSDSMVFCLHFSPVNLFVLIFEVVVHLNSTLCTSNNLRIQ